MDNFNSLIYLNLYTNKTKIIILLLYKMIGKITPTIAHLFLIQHLNQWWKKFTGKLYILLYFLIGICRDRRYFVGNHPFWPFFPSLCYARRHELALRLGPEVLKKASISNGIKARFYIWYLLATMILNVMHHLPGV